MNPTELAQFAVDVCEAARAENIEKVNCFLEDVIEGSNKYGLDQRIQGEVTAVKHCLFMIEED